MENKKIMVESLVSGNIGIRIPELNLARVWEHKGVKKGINFDVLEEALYDPGVETMFKEGILGVSKEDAIALGLTEEGRGEVSVVLDDFQRKRMMTLMPVAEFKEKLAELSYAQLMELVDFAVENELTDIEKCSIIKDMTDKDIIKMVQLERED